MASPTVSIILPTYNRADCLPEAIASVLAQTLSDFELLIVDDGSTDDTADVLHGYGHDPRVQVLSQPHRGISAAMNLGLRQARGDFIARIDSDDLWLPELLEIEIGELRQRPACDLVYAQARIVRAGDEHSTEVWGHAPRYPDAQLASMLYSDFTCNITVIARRECLARVGGYDEQLASSEDFDLWLRCAVEHRFHFVPRVLAHVRIRADGISFDPRHQRRNRQDRQRVLDKFFASPVLSPEGLAMKAAAYANLHMETALRHVGKAEYAEAFDALRKALATGDRRLRVLARFGYCVLANGPLRGLPGWQSLGHRIGRLFG